ncbi:MAG TPA: PilZ domain-containing protein [Spirochaetota bacterium]|mgnify:CR=1 FL=1|nr:PilZ domain-containing protein [Spirochaetota bacterium]HPH01669.1 PilZ domain-containing protein [Spirochaetota bacterium]
MTEQRRTSRLGFLKHLIIINGETVGYLEDLTMGGAGLVLTTVPTQGDRLSFTIRFHACLKIPEIALSGYVRWVSVPLADSVRVGVQFGLLDQPSQLVIRRYMGHASRVQHGKDLRS